jgi:uncharacterized protein (TIGR02172 family)
MKEEHPLGHGRTADICPWGEGRVIKLFNTDQEDRIHHEAAVSKRVKALGLRVPEVYGIVKERGRLGIVYERVDGPTLLTQILLDSENIQQMGRDLATLHHEIHQETTTGLPRQKDNLRRNIQAVDGLKPQVKKEILLHLDQLPEGQHICHGDFHPDNIIRSATKGAVFIDWATGSCEDPLGEVARTWLMLRWAFLPPAFQPFKSVRDLSKAYIKR